MVGVVWIDAWVAWIFGIGHSIVGLWAVSGRTVIPPLVNQSRRAQGVLRVLEHAATDGDAELCVCVCLVCSGW